MLRCLLVSQSTYPTFDNRLLELVLVPAGSTPLAEIPEPLPVNLLREVLFIDTDCFDFMGQEMYVSALPCLEEFLQDLP